DVPGAVSRVAASCRRPANECRVDRLRDRLLCRGILVSHRSRSRSADRRPCAREPTDTDAPRTRRGVGRRALRAGTADAGGKETQSLTIAAARANREMNRSAPLTAIVCITCWLAACALPTQPGPPGQGPQASAIVEAECHPAPDSSEPQYIVGYGSLMQD